MNPNLPPVPPLPQYAPPRAAYNPPPPPSNRRPMFWGLLAVGCCLAPFLILPILAAILFPVFAQAREKARFTSCTTNVKRLSFAATVYAQDWDQTLPAAKQWMTRLEPYTKGVGNDRNGNARPSEYAFHCPSVAPRRSNPDKFGYAYNSKLNDVSLITLPNISRIPMIYDSENLQKNANDPFKSVAHRHQRGAVVGYADGHVHADFLKKTLADE